VNAGDDGDGAPTKGRYSFRNLAMWQRAQDLTVAVLDIVRTLPNDRATGVLVQQLVRSCSSIAANIAEGHGRFAAGAYRNHLSIARGSANETIGWLDVLSRSGRISAEREAELAEVCEEVLRMISAQMIRLDRQAGRRTEFREERGEYVVD